MDKSAIKQAIVDLQLDVINDLEASIKNQTAADIDEEDTKDPEDYSHQEEATEMVLSLKKQIEEAKLDLNVLNQIEPENCDEVRPGALIKINGKYYFVGVASEDFELGGRRMKGISSKAPLYSVLKGRKKGETISYNNTPYTIEDVM